MAYTAIDDPTDYFNTVTYTGNGGTQSITGVGFQPDWLWIKNRGADANHNVVDSVRGSTKIIHPNTVSAEGTDSSSVTSFDSDGFSLGSRGDTNANSGTMVAWNWLAGTSFTNDASSTSVGTIDSAGSFNNTPGFSIVSYTGTGSNGTIKHGLNTAPQVVWAKSRTHGTNWTLGFNINSSINFTDAFALNQNYALEDYDGYWNDTAPTSSVVSLGAHQNTNKSGENYIAYCFSEKQGYSKFGSYTGNGNANGTFIYTGFKPAFIIAKKTSSTSDWGIFDNKRNTFNVMDLRLKANSSGADDQSSDNNIDFLSNGFKHRTASGWNAAATYIYMSFAENPFVSSSGVPTTAR